MSIDSLDNPIDRAWGAFRSPCMVALFLGCLSALSLAPFGFFPIWVVGIFFVLESIYRSLSVFRAFLIGWCFGSGYFIFGQYWTTSAFIDLFRAHIWLSPISLIFIPLVLGSLWGIVSAFAFYFRKKSLLFVLVFSAGLTFAEYCRSQEIVFGFSWNILGYSLYRMEPLLQVSSVIGVYGLSFIVMLLSSIPFLWGRRFQERFLTSFVYFLVALFAAIIVWGSFCLYSPTIYDESIDILILQPNLPQFKKDDAAYKEENLADMLDLISMSSHRLQSRSIILFPETMFTIHRDEAPVIYKKIGRAIPPDSLAVMGIRRFSPLKDSGMEIRNSMMFLDRSGNVVFDYDKHILTPWGETIPYEKILKKTFLASVIKDKQSLTAGGGPVTVKLQGMPAISPQICYESAYPSYTLSGSDRPELITLVSNDGITAGATQPYQSFLNVRVRAIETGVPIVRAANSGISAIIDAKGRVIASLDMNQRGSLKSHLPEPDEETIYSRFGDAPLLILITLIFVVGVIKLIPKRSSLI